MMNLLFLSWLSVLIFLLPIGCGGGEMLEKERSEIRRNLDAKKVSYEESDGVFYVRHKNFLSKNPTPYKKGEEACIKNFVMMTYAGVVFYTNSSAQSEVSKLGTDIATDLPLCFKIGEGYLMDGFDRAMEYAAVGDSAEIILSSDRAYGKKPVGTIPRNTPIRIIVIL